MTYLEGINDTCYTISDSEHEDLEQRILAAVDEGGAFLVLDDVFLGPVRVLVTPASSVVSREQSLTEELIGYDSVPDMSFIELPELGAAGGAPIG